MFAPCIVKWLLLYFQPFESLSVISIKWKSTLVKWWIDIFNALWMRGTDVSIEMNYRIVWTNDSTGIKVESESSS